MKILAIESSCDETAAAVVEDGWKVHANVIASSLELHKKTGGVVPEVAARDSALKIAPVIEKTLVDAALSWEDIDALAVTNGPGLLGSLLVGIEAAKTLSLLYKKPLIPVFHIAGHLFSNCLERPELPDFPVISLTVAGGHNDLYLWKEKYSLQKLGTTLDDAAGEAFDKGARMLGLSYPGGPALSKLAESGNRNAFRFPRPLHSSTEYAFSFSGLKTALRYELENQGGLQNIAEQRKADLAASYQEAIVESLITKLFRAADEHAAREVHLAGGVSANTRLRECFLAETQKRNLKTRIPAKMIYCTDNAAMIGSAAYAMWQSAKSVPTESFSFEKVQVDLSHKFRF